MQGDTEINMQDDVVAILSYVDSRPEEPLFDGNEAPIYISIVTGCIFSFTEHLNIGIYLDGRNMLYAVRLALIAVGAEVEVCKFILLAGFNS